MRRHQHKRAWPRRRRRALHVALTQGNAPHMSAMLSTEQADAYIDSSNAESTPAKKVGNPIHRI
jgi:hypothetical protein